MKGRDYCRGGPVWPPWMGGWSGLRRFPPPRAATQGRPYKSVLLSDELMTRQTLAQGLNPAPRIEVLGLRTVRRIGLAQRIGPRPLFRMARDPAPQRIKILDGAPAGRLRGTRRPRAGWGGEDPGRSEAQPEEDHQDGCSAQDSHDRLLSGRRLARGLHGRRAGLRDHPAWKQVGTPDRRAMSQH